MNESEGQWPKWEYCSQPVGSSEPLSDVLRRYGEDGWEAWALERKGQWYEVWFKRPKGEQQQ